MSRAPTRIVVLLGLAAFATGSPGGARIARADGEWTLLPQSEWTDEFSPRYTNGQGCFLEGDPTEVEEDDEPILITYTVADPETGHLTPIEAIQNEAVVNFVPSATAATIHELFEALHVKVLHAWFDPNPADPDWSLSWFNLEVLPTSSYYNDVPALLAFLRARSDVMRAGYSDVARLCGTALYTDEQNHPNDKVWTEASGSGPKDARIVSRLNLYNAWYDPTSDLGSSTNTDIAVVVMDTGIDLDHEEFVGKIYAKNGTARDVIAATKSGCKCGQARAWQAPATQPAIPPSGQTLPDPIPASDAPMGSNPDPLKKINLRRRWHGHGTAMAGIIGAKNDNGLGVVSAATDHVQVMSARLRMVDDYKVSVAGALPLVKELTKSYGKNSNKGNVPNMRVVYLGFAVDSPKRTDAMTDLLCAMKKDRTEGGSDRLWVAPASNAGPADGVTTLSYPAALLKRNATTDETGTDLPVILGVTGVELNGTQPVAAVGTNYFNQTDTAGNFLPLDRKVYGISAYWSFDSTVDVRDQWYGVKWKAGKYAPDKTAGYTIWNRYPAGNANNGDLQLATGGYGGSLLYQPGANKLTNLAGGNSVAAAEISALAGMLFSKHPAKTATQISEHIKKSQKVDGATHTEIVGGVTYQVIEFTPNKDPNSTVRARIPGAVDFLAALQSTPQ